MKHLDLFSGIGGFALAVDEVWPRSEHIFCEIDPYCRALLKKRFPRSVIYGDIRELRFDTVTYGNRCTRWDKEINPAETDKQTFSNVEECHLLTGGFPCQPFSTAGKRRGTDDNRYLWPEMLRVIREFKPTWVVAENVRGLITISGGLVFEQVCLDLEACGYEVQPFVIPACAVNAPHRRDRVWIVAYFNSKTSDGWCGQSIQDGKRVDAVKQEGKETRGAIARCGGINAPVTTSWETGKSSESERGKNFSRRSWETKWLEVATRFCGMDDGLPAELDGLKLSKARHRVERLKSLGNAIVPQDVVEILKAIKATESIPK